MATASTNKEIELIEFKSNVNDGVWEDRAMEYAGYGQLGFFVTIFGFFTTPKSKEFLMMKEVLLHEPMQVYLFPFAALLEMADAAFSGYKLLTAKNKDLDKTLEFSSKSVKGGIISSAVGMGVGAQVKGAVALAAIVPFLFVAAISLNTLYGMSAAVYHLQAMLRSPKGSAVRAAHRQALVKSAVRSAAGTLLLTTITGLFVLGVSTGVGLAVLASIGIVTAVGVLATSYFMKRSAKKAALKAEKRESAQIEKELKTEIKKVLSEPVANLTHQDIRDATKAAGRENDRYYVRDLSSLLNAAKRESNPTVLKDIFIRIIDAKIDTLDSQMKGPEGKKSASADKKRLLNRFFRPTFINEAPKRLAKIAGLKALREKIDRFDGTFLDPKDISDIADKHDKIFQSFRHNKSDVELIFDAAKEYFTEVPSAAQTVTP